jgi:hypothetical protein
MYRADTRTYAKVVNIDGAKRQPVEINAVMHPVVVVEMLEVTVQFVIKRYDIWGWLMYPVSIVFDVADYLNATVDISSRSMCI